MPQRWFTSYAEVPENYRKALKETMFSDTYTFFNNEEGRKEHADPLNLRRCIRIFPHD